MFLFSGQRCGAAAGASCRSAHPTAVGWNPPRRPRLRGNPGSRDVTLRRCPSTLRSPFPAPGRDGASHPGLAMAPEVPAAPWHRWVLAPRHPPQTPPRYTLSPGFWVPVLPPFLSPPSSF